MEEEPLFVLKDEPQGAFDVFSLLKELEKAPAYAFLESSRKGPRDRKNYLFTDPQGELVLRRGDDVSSFFRCLEGALAQGFWAVGFLAYELGYLLEPRLKGLPTGDGPLAYFLLFRAPEIFEAAPVKGYQPPALELSELRLNIPKDRYLSAIEKIKAYIAAGDTYQVNYTLKYHFAFGATPEEVYLSLRPKQRVSYGGMLKTKDFSVVSLSPELFLRREGDLIFSKPMKGTAPRGLTPSEDERISAWLASDPKNQAENVMIVDLLRNDLGRVCEPGSVYVPRLFEVEKYETVFQMTSTVEGSLKKKELWPIFKALFPCGSVTGAPKLRTMEIIAELEAEPRGVYTGAFGFLSPKGDFVFNVAIRTLYLEKGRGEFGLGSGIVWDSDPEAEYEECLLKAKFLKEKPITFCLLETMRFVPEEGIPLLPFHLKRLEQAAAYFDFPFERERVLSLLDEAQRELSVPARLRLLLSGDGGLSLEAYPLSPPPAEVRIGLARRDFPKSPFLFHKTTHRPWYERWRRRAQKEGFFEVVFYDEEGRLLEGTISNLFLELDGRLFTPPVELGLLPGVLRESLIAAGRVEERPLSLEDLKRAERVFIGNAVRGLLPVTRWEFLQGG